MLGQKLDEIVKKNQSVICLGLDPFIEMMPPEWKQAQSGDLEPKKQDLEWARLYCEETLEVAQGQVAAIKVQSAFFEAMGFEGVALFESLLKQARDQGFVTIADVKRGDIGTTAKAYAQAFLPMADAVTVNPYMGLDTISPFIEQAKQTQGGLFVLVRTSNPSAVDFQDIKDSNGQPLYEQVALKVAQWGQDMASNDLSSVGAVVGATWPEEGRRLRELMPQTPFLIPGYGAQGGTSEGVDACRRSDGRGILVNSSRGLLYAWKKAGSSDWKKSLSDAIDHMNKDLKNA